MENYSISLARVSRCCCVGAKSMALVQHWTSALKISGADHFLLQRIIKKSAADRNSDVTYRLRDGHIG